MKAFRSKTGLLGFYLAVMLVMGVGGIQAQVVFNDIRGLDVDDATLITVDGVVITSSQLQEIIGLGYKGRFRAGSDVNVSVSQGTLTELHLIIDYKGIVTSTSPLRVMDQPVLVTGDTVLVGLNDVATLQVGDEVSISGIIAADGSMEATRLEKPAQPLSEWKVRGYLQAVNTPPGTIRIGDLQVSTGTVTFSDCTNGPGVGDFVEIEGVADAAYSAGDVWQTASTLTCQAPDVDQDPDGEVPALIEGFITAVIDFSSFVINGVTVLIDNDTEIDNGELEHLDVGIRVEVQGILDSDTGLLSANVIRFLNIRIKAEGVVSPSDIQPGQSISLFGLVFQVTPQTRDDEGILANGLAQNRQVEVRGFVDDTGQLFALRVRDRGSPDPDDAELRGPVTSINPPLLSIQGVMVDTSASTLMLDEQPISATDFFAMLQVGSQIEVEYASFDAANGLFTGGVVDIHEVETEDYPESVPEDPTDKVGSVTKEIIGLGFTGGRGVATVTRVDNIIYRSGFE